MPLLNIDHKELQEIFRKKFLVDLVSMSDGKNATYVAEVELNTPGHAYQWNPLTLVSHYFFFSLTVSQWD